MGVSVCDKSKGRRIQSKRTRTRSIFILGCHSWVNAGRNKYTDTPSRLKISYEGGMGEDETVD